ELGTKWGVFVPVLGFHRELGTKWGEFVPVLGFWRNLGTKVLGFVPVAYRSEESSADNVAESGMRSGKGAQLSWGMICERHLLFELLPKSCREEKRK
ncbi:MAG: hypothetical protein IKD16_00265, partial [Bacteroidales bacterium]|nr:hypothetical protein [Bacteroidales bacterium]